MQVAPHLQKLEQQNVQLRRLAKEARHRLDQQVAAAVPNYQEPRPRTAMASLVITHRSSQIAAAEKGGCEGSI